MDNDNITNHLLRIMCKNYQLRLVFAS